MDLPTHLSAAQIELEIATRPGLIPVGVDAEKRLVTWVDLKTYHGYQGFFSDSLAAYYALPVPAPHRFSCGLDALASVRIPADALRPSSLIFHTGRSGSTLLARGLARSRTNLVFGEARAHNQIWRALAEFPDREIDIYRKLFLLMGRRRLPSYSAHVIKFTSFHLLRFEFIREAFPGVPALVLYRDPEYILHSFDRRSAEWLGKDTGIGKCWKTNVEAVEDFFRAAVLIEGDGVRFLNYADLNAGSLPAILRFFRLNPSPEERQAILSEFSWRVDSHGNRTSFSPQRLPAARLASDELRTLYRQLADHPQNLLAAISG